METSEFLKKVEDPLVKFLVEKGLKILLSKFAFLSFGPIEYILGLVLSHFLKCLIEAGILKREFIEIDNHVKQQEEDYKKAQSDKLNSKTDEERKKYEEEVKRKAGDLIDFRK